VEYHSDNFYPLFFGERLGMMVNVRDCPVAIYIRPGYTTGRAEQVNGKKAIRLIFYLA